MGAYLLFIGVFFGLAIVLLVSIHLAVTAEDRAYTRIEPSAPPEMQPTLAPPEERAA
jgi:hypothetical protein